MALDKQNPIPPSFEAKRDKAALDHFKKVNPHMAEDEYFHRAEMSQTIRTFQAAADFGYTRGREDERNARASVVPRSEWEKAFEEEYMKEHDWLHACLTGDCPHNYQHECFRACWNEALKRFAEPLARENAELKERLAVAEKALEDAGKYIGGQVLIRGHFREKIGGGSEYVRMETSTGTAYRIIKEALAKIRGEGRGK